MLDRSDKKVQEIEISLGLLVGYLIMGFINAFYHDKTWEMVFSSEHIITSIAGIILSLILFYKAKKKIKS